MAKTPDDPNAPRRPKQKPARDPAKHSKKDPARPTRAKAARPEQRVGLVEALLKAVGYYRVGNRPGRWEPRARKRRPKPSKRLNQPRHIAKQTPNRAKWY